MIRGNIDLSFPSPPPASLDKNTGCSISLHMGSNPPCLCVPHPFPGCSGADIWSLGLWREEIVEEGEAWARDQQFAHWLMNIHLWGEQECQSNAFYFSFNLFFLCLFSILQPVKFVTWGQLSIVISFPFLIHPPKGQIQRYAKAEQSSVFVFAALTVSLSLVIKTPMFLLFREVPYWVPWFNFSW